MTRKFEPDYLTMNDLFKRENIYCIPINQRKYSWKKQQYEEYWNDIINILDDTEKRHYLGVITLVKKKKVGISPDEYEVIDGQQRILTTLIFIAALRDIYVLIENIDKAKDINNTYLRFKTARQSYERVKSSKVDDFTLRSLVNISLDNIDIEMSDDNFRISDIDPSENINNNMVEAYLFFCKKIFEGYNNEDRDDEYLIQMEELLSKVEVITVVSEDISNIFLYFDSLNNRGLQLNKMDIIRNKFFNIIKKKFPDSMEYFGDEWDKLVILLDDFDCVKFLKYYYMCEKKNIFSANELPKKFEEMFEEINDYNNMNHIIKKMISYANIYVKIFAKHVSNDSVGELIQKINFLGQQACYSFVMDYFYYVKDESRRKIILEQLLIMNYKRIICNCSTKQLDGISKSMIEKKNKNDEYNDESIYEIIKNNTPVEEELKRELKSKIWDKDNITLFTLFLINNEQTLFKDIEEKGKYRIVFDPLNGKLSKNMHSFALVETSVLSTLHSFQEIKEITKLQATKDILSYEQDNTEDIDEYISNIICNNIKKIYSNARY